METSVISPFYKETTKSYINEFNGIVCNQIASRMSKIIPPDDSTFAAPLKNRRILPANIVYLFELETVVFATIPTMVRVRIYNMSRDIFQIILTSFGRIIVIKNTLRFITNEIIHLDVAQSKSVYFLVMQEDVEYLTSTMVNSFNVDFTTILNFAKLMTNRGSSAAFNDWVIKNESYDDKFQQLTKERELINKRIDTLQLSENELQEKYAILDSLIQKNKDLQLKYNQMIAGLNIHNSIASDVAMFDTIHEEI